MKKLEIIVWRCPLILFSIGLLVVGAAQVNASPISVPNYSFENPHLPTDRSAVLDAISWVSTGLIYTDNPPGSAFAGAEGSGTPAGGDLGQSVFLNKNSSIVSETSLWTVQPGDLFTLTVAIGARTNTELGTVRIGFLLDDAFVAGADTNFDAVNYSPEGAFADLIWSYLAQPEDSGKTLKVFLGSGSAPLNYDNVRVDVVPEPSTLALGLLGCAAVVFAARRRS